MAEILIIDDDPQVGETIGSLFERSGHHYTLEYTMDKGLARAMSSGYDLVFLDVNLPDGCGLDIINDLRGTISQPEVIIITGAGDANGAEIAINSNAWDYIEKGSSIKEFILSSTRALQYRQEKLASRKPVALELDHIVGKSAEMKKCYDLVAQAAFSLADVLITGETGTGKELIARAIHQNSSRAAKNFVVVDCAALPSSMIGSVLFGHEKGAFTGAEHRHKGLIAQAEGGTLFLDEVGELSLEMQKNFLRVLQEHRYRPLGSEVEYQSNFRLIAATNKNINHQVQTGEFRQDLLFRLKTLEIKLPPLRKRLEDIKSIAAFHQKQISVRYGGNDKSFSAEFLDALETYNWPGNVRELVNAIEFAYSKAGRNKTLLNQHLPLDIRVSGIRRKIIGKNPAANGENHIPAETETLPSLKEYRTQMDKLYLDKLMHIAMGEVKKAIEISGLSRSAFYALQQKYQKS